MLLILKNAQMLPGFINGIEKSIVLVIPDEALP